MSVKSIDLGYAERYEECLKKAKENGIRYMTFYKRIHNKRRKWTLEEAATTPVLTKKEVSERMKEANAKIPDECFEKALSNGISKPTLRTRIFILNWDMERATTKPPDKRFGPKERGTGKKFNYQAPTTKEVQQAASVGVSRKLLDQRLCQGWSMERAITTPVGTSYEGQEKNVKMLKLAAKNGISESTFYRRRRDQNMTPYEAAITPKSDRYRKYVIIAKRNGIDPQTFYKRVERKMDPLKAAMKPPRKYKKNQIS
ncbi:hypothetical protein COF59_08235 [Bacillus pseudomycoides]|uniref:hypothetical protein n=1 Tax=Bacillus pseudomycoides TaxID=64104 RepID=UPI000BFCA52C|nr:hypothetical protein [Bacillus pseudomycoides]PHE19207.1 hypothetical protein COF59_08235 [Bacillus pseudomycoides]